MRVLVAFDKFKDAIDAPTACTAVADALRIAQPGWVLDLCPLADGGDGFARILTHAADGEWHPCRVTGPLPGRNVAAGYGLVPTNRIPAAARAQLAVPDGTVGVIEMAAASGLGLLPLTERNPWFTTSRGTGELLVAAAEGGANSLLLGIGGSATNDLGLGALTALGWRGLTATGEAVKDVTPGGWLHIDRLERSACRLPPLRIACDVSNPLLGPEGATSIFGPQKGLRPDDLPAMEQAVARMAHVIATAAGEPVSAADLPGSGAAGGLAFGLKLGAHAELLPGAALVAAWLDLERRIAAADLVITGEGRFDRTSLGGKGPGAVVARALAQRKKLLVLAGQIDPTVELAGGEAVAITPAGEPLAQALARTVPNLTAAIRQWLA